MKTSFLAFAFFLVWGPSAWAQVNSQTMIFDGRLRSYLIYAPDDYDGTTPWPLVINMHPYNEFPASHMARGMNAVADTAHFLVAYPAGLPVDISEIPDPPSWFPTFLNGWNLGGNMSTNDDLGFIDSMITEIEQGYQVDADRIYATGFSMGAIMCYKLACELSGRLAAIAPVGGTQPIENGILGWNCTPEELISVMLIHGTNDVVNNFYNGIELRGANSTIAFWRNHNDCPGLPIEETLSDLEPADQSTVTRYRYEDCDQGKTVWLYQVNGGGHTWPGDTLPVVDPSFLPINRDIDANVEIWKFFSQQSRGEITSNGRPKASEAPRLTLYPNPSPGPWTVELELPQRAEVDLALYNAMGQQVAQLRQGPLPAGEHALVGPAGLAAGLYHLRLIVAGQFVTKTVILP